MRVVWALIGILFGLLCIYAGYLFFTAGIGAKLLQKGIYLQAPPILGGLALMILALPLIWNCVRLLTVRTERY
ncbi:MAG: hypothetical protein NVSMB2_00010 [Chloroflexota bacterium]